MADVQIGLFGSSTSNDKKLFAIAQETGRLIAEKKATLFCGNVLGVMSAALKGAKQGGGRTVVIVPYEEAGQGDLSNCDVYIPSAMNWFSRGGSLVNAVDGIIVVGGGVGTISELTYAWWKEIPVVIIETGELIDQYIGKGFDKRKKHKILGAKTPKEAVEKLFELISKHS
ncbi:LOG family protein [Candidatus Woesearchaeota archaeon]|nr:LOG family protein [Candidatus Woesearchaeota archaeon]